MKSFEEALNEKKNEKENTDIKELDEFHIRKNLIGSFDLSEMKKMGKSKPIKFLMMMHILT